ncbi:MAG: ATP-binding protein, partial [Dehalococcoidia bacterium]|nr:ATP-binding protein [Dehalococcoidia bacterium]
MRSITLKLTLSFLLVIVVAVGLVAFVANLGAQNQFATYLEAGPTVMRLDHAIITLTSYYLRNGRWDGVQSTLEALAVSEGGRFVLTDGQGLVLADSSRELTGRTVDEASYGEAGAVFVDSRQVGVVHFIPKAEASRLWWEGPSRQPGAQGAAPPTGSGGMMSGMMGGASSEAMGQMMGGWQLPSTVVGPSEQAYLSGLNNSLWLGGLGAALVALVLAVFSARRISWPLRRLAEASSRIARGDLTQRVEVSSRDEVGQLAASFNSMAEALARNEETRRHLMTDIAHELRTPLTVLQGNFEGMLDGVVPLDKETVSTLHQETQLLSRLVSDLQELSLAEAGQLQLYRSPTDMNALCHQALDKMTPQAQSKGISLEIVASDGLPLVEADADRVSQVLANLLSNALRHTPAGGKVTLTLQELQEGTETLLRVSIADTGSGISPEDLPHVFDRFYRADRSRSRSTGGTGLGLAIVKQLVEAHGGRVRAESQPGYGATFLFT